MPKRPTNKRSEILHIRISPQDLAILDQCKEYHGSGCNSSADVVEFALKQYLIFCKERENSRDQDLGK